MDGDRERLSEVTAPRDYACQPGVPDEMIGPDGLVRPLWRPLARALASALPQEIELRRARAEQYLRDSGVFYRQYGAGRSDERPWPLSPVPVLVDQADWDALTPGLIQRAELLEALMADLYGPNRMVADAHLPPELLAGNGEWLRPMVGVRPRSGHFLHFLAFEIGRGPDGKWWVLADRTQAPSGAGYALENRVATSRAFSDLYAGGNIHRLAGFFRDFRNALLRPGEDSEGRVVILSPGPMNETYFEHAYIARYLGFTLVQGEDLTVLGGRVHVRTVSGPRPAEVIWRRLDSTYADPVELDPGSRIGTPGMVSALRAGGVTMINSLGSGVLETRALMAFLPRLSRLLLGQPLALPNIATWWLGGAAERGVVQASPSNLMLSRALATGAPFEHQGELGLAANLPPDELAARLARDGAALVAQEVVRLSTTPTLIEGRLMPRPMALRVFLARVNGRWQVMPGGFARIGASPDPAAIAMQRGGSTADVWVVSDKGPVAEVSLTGGGLGPYRRVSPGALPARAADNLFWLGRYVERTEATVRLLRACNMRMAETGASARPLLAAIEPLLEFNGITADRGIPPGLLETLSAAIATAGRVRDRFSPDAWSALVDIDKTARRMETRVAPGDDAARALSALLRKLAGISGLVHENMYRFLGWRFLTLGRLHERAMGMSAMLAILADPDMPEGALDIAVELGDSVMTHRRRFAVSTTRETVIDLLGLDEANPRSLRHQIDGLRDQISRLPGAYEGGNPSTLMRAAMRLQVTLATEAPETLGSDAIWDLRAQILALSDLITGAYFH
ncbi:circularly permuted type 2 ATP-grasp protein [Pseudogemmobacter sonorensis]|uniref:circularly permuted type 2 ATP-grasp protein n=1 Tax=Pseudogemmobacter sonorensis TaxID=2989681 RepID=UPI0036956173